VAERDLWDKFWKNKQGEVVVYQHPNILLIAWLILALSSLFALGTIAEVLWYGSLAFLAAWAIREMIKGVNYFRRGLGGFILLIVILAAFRIGL
jgi:hypothetical protein